MSEKNITPADIIRLAIAAARAAAGEFTGLAVEAARHSRKIASIVIVVVIGVLLLFTTLMTSVFNHIPGFEALYDIYRTVHPPTYSIAYTETGQNTDGTEHGMVFPIPAVIEYSMLEADQNDIEIRFSKDAPIIAIEAGNVISADETSLLMVSTDRIRKYQYYGIQCQDNGLSENYNNSDTGILIQAGEVIGYPLPTNQAFNGQPVDYSVKIKMWLKEKDKWISANPYQLLRLLSVSNINIPSGSKGGG